MIQNLLERAMTINDILAIDDQVRELKKERKRLEEELGVCRKTRYNWLKVWRTADQEKEDKP